MGTQCNKWERNAFKMSTNSHKPPCTPAPGLACTDSILPQSLSLKLTQQYTSFYPICSDSTESPHSWNGSPCPSACSFVGYWVMMQRPAPASRPQSHTSSHKSDSSTICWGSGLPAASYSNPWYNPLSAAAAQPVTHHSFTVNLLKSWNM